MKTKKLTLARTALRWGLISIAIGIISLIISFIIGLFIPYENLNFMQPETIFSLGGILFFGLGLLIVFLVSLTFLPSIIKYTTKNTQQHLSHNKKNYHSATKVIIAGIVLVFVALFKVWAAIGSNNDEDKEEYKDEENDDIFIDGDFGADSYYTKDPFYAYNTSKNDDNSLKW